MTTQQQPTDPFQIAQKQHDLTSPLTGYKHYNAPPVHPDVAKPIIESRLMPKIWQHPVSNLASNTTQGAPSIVEMARALKNDPQLIYEFVYNNIEHAAGYGLAKGALGTLLDGAGSSFDQCALLAALLRQAGFTANYEIGQVQINPTQAAAWLGCDTGFFTAYFILAAAGIPVSVTDLFNPKIVFSHCWLRVNIGTVPSPNWVVMDPSFKTYTSKTRIDLPTAMSYSQSTLLTQARSGYTIDGSGNWVQNVNRANTRSQLNTLSGNLASWIKTNNPGATTDDIIGGRQIIPVTLPITFPATLPNQKVGDVPTEFTGDFSTAYKITVRIQYTFGGIDVTLTSDQLCGHRLTFFFTPSGSNFVPVIALDGVTVATGTAQSANITWSVDLTVTHNAFATPLVQASAPYIVGPNQNFVTGQDYYAIVSSFGPTGKGSFDYHNALQLQNEFNAGGWSPTLVDEPALGERLVAMWSNYAAQVSRVTEISDRMTDKVSYNLHTIGLAVYTVYGTPYFSGMNLSGGVGGGADLNSTANPLGASAGLNGGMHGYALEMLAVQQLATIGGHAISTTRDLDLANTAGTKIWKGTPSTWTSTVRPALTGYSSSDLSNIDSNVSSGSNVLLAQSAGQTFDGHWTLTGYTLFGSNSAIGVILGAYAGVVDPHPTIGNPPKLPTKPPKTPDPISLVDGSFYYERTDLTIGSGEPPYRLDFTRQYNSVQHLQDSPLGLGWTHNYGVTATAGSDGLKGLASDSVIDGTASIVEIFVCLDLLSDTTLPVDKLVIVTLCNQWWVDQLTGNVVTVTFQDGARTFTKLPDLTYNPQPKCADTLIQNVDGTYKYTTPQQIVINFNTAGNVATWVYPNGVTITFNYTAGVLTSVSNGLGRTLTLNYTSGRLTSVSDGTGRSVGYLVDGSKNLTQVTDANSKLTTYLYDNPGRMTKYFNPANPTTPVSTNVYDSLGRVQSQTNALSQLTTLYLAGARSEMVDPAGNSSILYFNRFGSTVRTIDALGFKRDYVYDGLQRQISKTLPEGNQFQWVYDSKNNVLVRTSIAKSGSGLANIVENFTYDATYNKVHTFQDGRGNTTTYNYDAATGNLLNVQRPLIGGLVPQITYSYNGRGQVLTETDETGVLIHYTYDVITEELLTRVVDFGSSPHLNLTTQYGYNTVGDITSWTDPRNNTWAIQFDNLRRKTQVTDPAPLSYVTKFAYDDNSNVTSVQHQTGDVMNPWQTTSFTYSVTDKRRITTDPNGFILTLDYDTADRIWKRTDAEMRVYQFAYDQLNRIFQVTDPTLVISDSRTYTNNGKLFQRSDSRSKTTTYSYDGFDRSDRTTFADTTYEENQVYDANSNVLTYRTRSGNTIVNTFDVLNRLATKAPQGQPTVTLTYDLAGRLIKANKPVVVGDPSTGDFQAFYDTAGRFYKEQYPDAKTVVHIKDATGNITKTTWPDGYFVDRIFDQDNRLTNIKLNGASTSAATFAYDSLSRRKKLTLGNGVITDYTYQLNDDMLTLVDTFVGSNATFTYGYNKVHQLTSQNVSDGLFLWHPAAASTVNYGVANTVNEYPTVGGGSYLYDGNANLKSDGTWTYTFDTENHLLTANKTGTSASYVYDPSHRQVQKTVGSTKTRYVYAGWKRIADYNGATNALQNRYVYGVGLDEPLVQVSSAGVLTYLHADRLGSIIATTSSTGTVTNKSKYSPFGEGAPVGTTFGFTGQRYDAETGLYYYKLRYYSPAIGRFLQPDPIPYIDGLNLFAYVSNDPFQFVDPLGLYQQTSRSSSNITTTTPPNSNKKKRQNFQQGGAINDPPVDQNGQYESMTLTPGGESSPKLGGGGGPGGPGGGPYKQDDKDKKGDDDGKGDDGKGLTELDRRLLYELLLAQWNKDWDAARKLWDAWVKENQGN